MFQARGSTLAAWFSGRWEDCLDRDDQGRAFLDFDPDLFQPILSFLRSCAICSNPDARPAFAGIAASKQRAFTDLVKYLTLDDFLGNGQETGLRPLMPSFSVKTPEITISNNGQRARVTSSAVAADGPWPTVFVDPPCGTSCFLKFTVTSWGSRTVFAGLAAKMDAGAEFFSLRKRKAHGWFLPIEGDPMSHTRCLVKGRWHAQMSPAPAHISQTILRRGSWVLVKADFTSQKLVMRSSESNGSFSLPLEVVDHASLHFVIVMKGSGADVKLLPVTPKDQASLNCA